MLPAAMLLAGCGFEVVAGRSMGTTYAIQADCPGAIPRDRIDAALDRVVRQMSTYDPHSELAEFNRAPVGVAVAVSPAVVEVVATAQEVAERTGGAFDATVAPLVSLWGFGAAAAAEPPTAAQVRAARAEVGFSRLRYRREPPSLEKQAPLVLDLSAIAKGYAVDQLADMLEEFGCGAYLVELGGEIRAFGTSPGGGPWRIGVDSPDGKGHVAPAIVLRRGAVATAGDYRQYHERDGARVAHIIDPRTGYPVPHRLASVTVVAETALLADAYATALMVLGEASGMRFAKRHELAALFLTRAETGLRASQSAAMDAHRAH